MRNYIAWTFEADGENLGSGRGSESWAVERARVIAIGRRSTVRVSSRHNGWTTVCGRGFVTGSGII